MAYMRKHYNHITKDVFAKTIISPDDGRDQHIQAAMRSASPDERMRDGLVRPVT